MPEKINAYKYSTFVLVIIVVVLIAFISYNAGKESNQHMGYATQGYTTQATTMQAAQQIPQNCATPLTQVSVGSDLVCGQFVATLLNVTANSAKLGVYYNGTNVNASIYKNTGYISNVTPINISGARVYAQIYETSVLEQAAYIEMSTSTLYLTTTVPMPSTTT